ncbi:hypothetical protein C0J52_28426 [Blattella germanica]|nr:hypothetical protein C0J52_28426 [Blattella germanica]
MCSQKAKTGNGNEEVKEINKLQEQLKQHELFKERLQDRINLLQTMVLGSTKVDTDMERRRALRRRTWCGNSLKQAAFASNFEAISEESITYDVEDLQQPLFLNSSVKDLANNDLFDTPLEEFELQLIGDQNAFSSERLESPDSFSNITCRNPRGHRVRFEESIEQMENVPVCSKSVDASVQTEACPTNILLQRAINCGETAFSTPPPILRERINYFQREYDELREFTTLEKQIFDNISYKQVECLEKENKTMQRTMVDQENMLLDLNSKISNLTSENKLLREQLEFKTKKNTELTNKLLPLGDMENTLTAKQVEVGELQKKLKVAAQRIQILENEKSDFDMTWKLAENKLQLRITELTQSLQEAWNELDNQCSNNVDTNAQSESDKRNNDRPQTHGHPGTTNSLEKLTNVNEFSDSYEQLKQNYGYVNKELVRKMQEIDTLNMKVRELSSKENSSFGNIEMLATNPEVISSEKKSIPETIHDIKQMELKQSNIEDFVKIYEELNNKYNYVNEELSNNVKENYILKLKVEELLIAVKDSGSKDTEILAISHEESMSKKEIVADKETVCHLETLQFDLDNHSDTKEFMEMYNHFKQKLDYVNKELGEKLKEIDILKFQVQDLINGKEKNVKCTQILTEQEDVTLPERETDTTYKEIQCNLGTYVDMHLYVTLKDKYEVLKHNSDLINGELSKKVREIGSLKLQIQELVSEKDTCLKCKRNREEIILENKAISDVGEMQCPHETVTDNLDEQTGTVEFKKNYNQLKESYDYVNEELGKKVTEIEKLNSQIQELVSERQATHTEISTGKHEVISTENVINTKYEERECHSDTLDERCLNKSLGLESENTCKSLLMKENCALKKENVLYVEQLKEKEKAMKLLMDRIEEISVEKEVSNNEKDIKISKNNKDELNLMSSKLFPGYFGVELIKRLESEIVDLHEQSLECSNILEKVKTELQKLEISEQYEMENYDYISETSSNLNAGLKEVYQTILIKIKQFEEFKLNYRNTSALFEANKNLVKQLESTAHDLSEKLNAEISKSDLLNCQLQELTGFSNPCDILDSNIIAELETTKKKLFINIREIDVCRRVIVKEIKSLNPECDIEWNSDLSEQLKTLLDLIMEKEAELISHLQLESEKLRREMNENSRAFADKDRRRNIWVTELETEIQSMQSEFSKEIDKMKENIKILQEERNDLLNKIKQFESDSALVKTLKGERDDLTAEVQSYQNKLAYIKDLEKERNMLITNAKQFEEDLARIEILREKELVTLKLEQDENDSLHKALEEQRAELLKKSQQSEHVSSYIKGLKEEQDDLIRKSENDLSHIKVLNDEKAELKRKLHQAVTDLDLVKLDMHNLCSTNKTITEELNSIKLLLQQKDTKISHLCNELHHLEELENSLSCLNEQLKNSNIEIATLKECLLDLKSKHSQLTELIRNKDQELIEKDIILSDLNKKLEYKIEKSNKIRNELMIQIETMEENVADLKSENSKLMETLRNKEEDITQKNIELSELNSKLEVQIQESNKAKRELELHIDRLKINFTNLNSKFENKDKELIQNSCDQHKKLEDQIEQSNKTKNELKMQLKTLEEILTNMNLKNSKQNQLLQDKDKEIIEKNILLSELHKKLEDQLQQSNKTKAELKVQIKTLEGDIVDLKSRILQPMKLIENKEIKDVPSVQHKATDGEQYSKNKCYALAYSSEMEDTMLCQNNKIFVLQEEINFLKEEIVIEKNKNSEFMEILETKVTEIKECNKKLEHKNTEHLEIKNQLNIIILDLKESSKKNAVLHKSNEELLKTNSLLEKKVKELKEKNRLLVEENKNAISHIEDFNLIYEKLKETPVKDVTKCSVATATDITGEMPY